MCEAKTGALPFRISAVHRSVRTGRSPRGGKQPSAGREVGGAGETVLIGAFLEPLAPLV